MGIKTEKGYPQSLDYFICDSKYKKYFEEVYPGKPDTIQVCFISDEFTDSCFERFECRDQDGRLAGYGDGMNTFIWNAKRAEYIQESDRQAIANAGKWEIILTLKFIIPAIRGVFGLFSFSTKGSNSSLPQIREAFDAVKEQAGTVVNIPFDLVVKKVKSQKPGTKYLFPVVNLVPNISQQNMEIVHNFLQQGNDIRKLGLIDDGKIKLLTNENQGNSGPEIRVIKTGRAKGGNKGKVQNNK